MKTFFSSLLSLAMVMGVSPALAQSNLTDIGGTRYSEAVQYLEQQGIVEGFRADGTFRPDQPITREEFVKIVVQSADLLASECKDAPAEFSDVAEDRWSYQVICSAVQKNIVTGYPDGTFRPRDSINYAEAAAILSKVQELDVPQSEGAKWFEGFINALEEERVVSDEVGNPSQNLTRGQMAEAIHALDTGREVVNLSRGDLPEIDSCRELSRQFYKYWQRSQRPYVPHRRWAGDDAVFEESSDDGDFGDTGDFEIPQSAPTSDGGTSSFRLQESRSESEAVAKDFSQTNIQEFGVDEADIIKNDGKYIYLIKSNTVRIIEAYPPEEMKQVAEFSLADEKINPMEMYVDGDTLTVIANHYGINPYAIRSSEESRIASPDILPYPSQSMVSVVSFDISDRTKPEEIRAVTVEGNHLSSRKIGDVVYLVANYYQYYPWQNTQWKDDMMPALTDSSRSEEQHVGRCGDVRYIPNFADANFLMVLAIDTIDTRQSVGREIVLGSGSNVYASSQNLYVTREWWQEIFDQDFANQEIWPWKRVQTTEFYRFGLDENEVEFTGKGETQGRVLNQFAMSEYGDQFRIATQKDRQNGSSVTIFDKDLEQTGAIDGIAPGEDIKSVRFMGKKGYVVTFENVDPLFVLDLDPTNPKILGELKIPGWSDYLHPYDEDHLLGFGREVDPAAEERGRLTTSDLMGMKLSVFDVSDVSNPIEKHKTVIGERGTTSELLYNHKALLFDKNRGILGFPIQITDDVDNDKTSFETVFSGGIVFDVDLENGFTERGRATNYDASWFEDAREYFYGEWDRNIQRMIFIGEYFYSIAPNFVQALDGEDISVVNSLQLYQKACEEIYRENECSANAACNPVWRVVSECTEEDGKRLCEDQEEFLRCEAK